MGARFVRLRITGFKSFADATSMEILPGLTGIVGPNGCGKSNVAEALRWAMGEANARHLRGGEMDDIIFAGTANRPSRNLAEVSLTIEADAGEAEAKDAGGLPPPFTGAAELQVARRIERGSGSSYRVNGRETRARDVQTLFADLASGARSAAMVSQGRVTALVNARPDERRAVLEEAAGITGLHARRAEAETRLSATEANLERAAELRGQLQQQLDSLRGQAKQAARYRTVMTGVLEAEAALLALLRARAERAGDQAGAAVETARAAIDAATARSIAALAEAALHQASLPALRDQESSALAGAERARAAADNLKAESGRAQAALEDARKRHAQLARDLAHAESSLGDAEAADARLVSEAERLRAEAEHDPAAATAALAAAAAAAAALGQADHEAALAAAAATAASAQTGAAQHLLAQATARVRRAEEAAARLTGERQRLAAESVDPQLVTAAIATLGKAELDAAAARAAQERAEAGRAQAAPLAAEARQEQVRLDAHLHRVTAEAAALTEVLSVKDGERWPPLLDRVVVPAGLEAALGAALGEELAAAANPDAARHWRALPAVTTMAPYGRPLAEAVQAPPLLARALSGIGLVQSDAEGDAVQASLPPGQSVVSATGGVWRWDGYTIRAGAPTAAAIRLQQRNRLARLQDERTAAAPAADAARAARERADQAERASVGAEQQARQARREAEAAAERARHEAQALRTQADAAAARLAVVDEQTNQLAPELEAAARALQAVRDELVAQPELGALRQEADRTRAAVVAARQRDLAATRDLDSVRRAGQLRQSRLLSIGREREDRQASAAEFAARVIDLRARGREALVEQERLAATPARVLQDAEAARRRVDAAEAAAQTARGARVGAEQAAQLAATELRHAEQAVATAREQHVRAEGLLDAAQQGLATALGRIAERDGALPPCPAPVDLSDHAEERARVRLHRLTKERDTIGPVNLRAELELQAIEAQVETIAREGDELGSAIAKLRGSIGHLNREGRERLSAVFLAVDRHFQALFGRMFGGGRAHLALVGSDDPLRAGLEIYAQPPGKKLTALSLLSGGEQALTALSLIFAVFRSNPAPLCVLDEVDAPLDDANVGRFCSLLSDMAQQGGTRFLVVTHHQLTMAGMDRLYGVTMQERGVSSLLSVDLSRAVGMVEAVAAE